MPPSPAITFVPAAPFSGSGTSFEATGPIAAGAMVGSIIGSKPGAKLSLSGANAVSFRLSGTILVAAGTLPTGVYDVTIAMRP